MLLVGDATTPLIAGTPPLASTCPQEQQVQLSSPCSFTKCCTPALVSSSPTSLTVAQFIAAYAPTPPFAALAIPVTIAVLVTFSGVLIPYDQLTVFWRYWLYYLDPFNYLLGALMTFTIWDAKVTCSPEEYGHFDPPNGTTCGDYMAEFFTYSTGYLRDPVSLISQSTDGSLQRSTASSAGTVTAASTWRTSTCPSTFTPGAMPSSLCRLQVDVANDSLFCVSSYALVFLLLKLRSKRSKTAS